MSELIEIDEDNCVLHEGDMRNIDNAFNFFVHDVSKGYLTTEKQNKNFREIFIELFLKIAKLNDLAKARQEENK